MNNVISSLKAISQNKRHLEKEAHNRIPGLVSVCIPNFNKGKWIFECLESIHNQIYSEIEIIVVDDFSTDTSRAQIQKAMYNLPKKINIRPLFLPRRVGTAWAQNIAYFLSKGEFIANMDSDDISDKWRIHEQVEAIRSNNWDVCGTNFSLFDGKKTICPDGGYWLKYDSEEISDSYLFKGVHCVCFGTLMFKSKVLESTGGMNKEFIGTEDFEFVLRCAQKGYAIGNLKKPLYFYRTNETQRSTKFHSS